MDKHERNKRIAELGEKAGLLFTALALVGAVGGSKILPALHDYLSLRIGAFCILFSIVPIKELAPLLTGGRIPADDENWLTGIHWFRVILMWTVVGICLYWVL